MASLSLARMLKNEEVAGEEAKGRNGQEVRETFHFFVGQFWRVVYNLGAGFIRSK